MELFVNDVDPCDIYQGYLGDCYFLSGLAVLAEKPDMIKRLFEYTEVNEKGAYCVWLCHDGAWECFLIDDLIPSYQN